MWHDIWVFFSGLIVGAVGGAVGKYFADKHTDQRKAEEERKARKAVFTGCEAQMPELFKEMRHDLKEYPLCRDFIIVTKAWNVKADRDNPFFQYYFETHADLKAKLIILQNHEFVQDITAEGSLATKYRMTEKFVALLIEHPQ